MKGGRDRGRRTRMGKRRESEMVGVEDFLIFRMPQRTESPRGEKLGACQAAAATGHRPQVCAVLQG